MGTMDEKGPLMDDQQPGACSPACVEVLDRITTTADENFGPFPVQSADASITAIEAGIFALRTQLAAAEERLECSMGDTAAAEDRANEAERLLRRWLSKYAGLESQALVEESRKAIR
jgi:hypothetical protein